jgi:hypothetical protein
MVDRVVVMLGGFQDQGPGRIGDSFVEAIGDGLRAHGFVAGENHFDLQAWYANGDPAQFSAFVDAANPERDVVIALDTRAAPAVAKYAGPVVFATGSVAGHMDRAFGFLNPNGGRRLQHIT